jgi:hypothetical protein
MDHDLFDAFLMISSATPHNRRQPPVAVRNPPKKKQKKGEGPADVVDI